MWISVVLAAAVVAFSALAAPSSLAAPASSDWLTGLHSPLIQEDGQEKKLKLRFDVAQYTPEEIVVKTVDNKLLVSLGFLLCSLLLFVVTRCRPRCTSY